jgi:hypothetical protein
MDEVQAGDGTAGDRGMTAHAQEKVQETAQRASEKSGRYLREQTEARASQLGDELRAVAEALRRSGHTLHADGRGSAGAVVDGVTERIEGLSHYLGGTSGDRMLRDIESFGRRKPLGMVGVGLGLGIVASRFLKASSQTRYRSSQALQGTHARAAVRAPALPPPDTEAATPVGQRL